MNADYYPGKKTKSSEMEAAMALTLFQIRSLAETWNCPAEEKL
jgi:hypothetical protein